MHIRPGAVAIVGVGKMGEALLTGLLGTGVAPQDITVLDPRAKHLAETYAVTVADTPAGVETVETVILAVKPQDVATALAQLSPHLGAGQLVVSVAAGISTASMEANLPAGVAVVRCMPNTPAVRGEAMTAIAAGSRADESHLARAETLLSAVGKVVRVSERQLDAVTALSGSGPAYFFYLAEAMIEAGVELGLPRELSSQLVLQTAFGAALLLRDSGQRPAQLREAVTSPGGTTSAAVGQLDDHGVREAVHAAIAAASARSAELGA